MLNLYVVHLYTDWCGDDEYIFIICQSHEIDFLADTAAYDNMCEKADLDVNIEEEPWFYQIELVETNVSKDYDYSYLDPQETFDNS